MQQALLRLLPERAAQFHLRHGLTGEPHQAAALPLREFARPGVEDADGADRLPLGGLQQGAGVEAQAGLAADQGIAGEAWVARGVRHVEEVVVQDGLPTEGGLERRLAHAEADLRLEELPPVADEVDHRDRCLAQLGGGLRDFVEILLARRVEQPVAVQGAKARSLSLARRGGVHRADRIGGTGLFQHARPAQAKVRPIERQWRRVNGRRASRAPTLPSQLSCCQLSCCIERQPATDHPGYNRRGAETAQAERLARNESTGYPTAMLGLPSRNLPHPTGAVRPTLAGRRAITGCDAVDGPSRGEVQAAGVTRHG